jgi:hypothetical protein
MATQGNIQPKADQPRVGTDTLKRTESGPNLEYRTQGVQSFARAPKTRNIGRSVRG